MSGIAICMDAAVQDPDVIKTLRETAIEADKYLIAPMMRWNVNGTPAPTAGRRRPITGLSASTTFTAQVR
jgi:hypothetical protein